MFQAWFHSVPNATPTLIVGFTFEEIREFLANPLNIRVKVSENPTPTERDVPVPMDVYVIPTRTKEDIDQFYAKSRSIAALYDPIWHSRATIQGIPSMIIALSFDDLDRMLKAPLEFLWVIEGKNIDIPFNILLLSGETREEMQEWFLKEFGIKKARIH